MKQIFVILACVWLAACGNSPISLTTKPLEIDIASTADPVPVTMLPMQFRVVNKDNLESFLAELRVNQDNANAVFFAITTRDYENLSLNLADIRRYIEQQQAVITYYRNLTTRPTRTE
jgi:hypothetical protein